MKKYHVRIEVVFTHTHRFFCSGFVLRVGSTRRKQCCCCVGRWIGFHGRLEKKRRNEKEENKAFLCTATMHGMIWVVGIILLIVVLVILVRRRRRQHHGRKSSNRKEGDRFKRVDLSVDDDDSCVSGSSSYTSKTTEGGGFAYIVTKEVEQNKHHEKTISSTVERTSIFHKTGFEQDLRGANSKGERLFYSLSEVGVGGADPNPVIVLVSAATLVTKRSDLSNFQATFNIKDLANAELLNANLRVELFVQKAGSPDYEMTSVQWSKPINQPTETDKSMANEVVAVQEGDHFVFLMYLDNTKAHASVLQLSLSYDYTTTTVAAENTTRSESSQQIE